MMTPNGRLIKMKNVKFLMGVLAMGALVVAGCSKKDNKQDMDNIAEDGFYVVGAATAVESVNADNMRMGATGWASFVCLKFGQ